MENNINQGLSGAHQKQASFVAVGGWKSSNCSPLPVEGEIFSLTCPFIDQAIAILVFAANLIISYFKGAEAGNDPWDAWTLEWSTSSPPPAYNFASIPVVASRRPLWDQKHPEDPDSLYE